MTYSVLVMAHTKFDEAYCPQRESVKDEERKIDLKVHAIDIKYIEHVKALRSRFKTSQSTRPRSTYAKTVHREHD